MATCIVTDNSTQLQHAAAYGHSCKTSASVSVHLCCCYVTCTVCVAAGEPLKLCIDPGGVMLICCHADGCLRLYSLATGQLMWRAWGHADMVASAAVSPDLTRLVSVGGDGCVIVWKLPEQLVTNIQTAVARVAAARMHLVGTQQQERMQEDRQQTAAETSKRLAWGTSSPLANSPAATVPGKPEGAKPTYAAAAGFSTPSAVSLTGGNTPSSDAGASSTLQRLRQGKPLVSTDKLPKWARSPASPSSPASAKAQQQPSGKWLGSRQQAVGKWQVNREVVLHSDGGLPVALQVCHGVQDGGRLETFQ